MPDVITLTRQELYEQVWTTPIRKLAGTFGLSDVGLAKICKKHRIPRPPRGYWAKLEVGKAPRRARLPDCNAPELQTIHISRSNQRDIGPRQKAPELEYDADLHVLLERAKGLPLVALATTLRNLHPLVQTTKESLEGATPDRHNLINPLWGKEPNAICLSVSEGSVRRSLVFLDALVKAIEQVGGKVEVKADRWRRETTVSFCGELITPIRLRERSKQEKRTPPPNKIWDRPKYDFIPTGRLVLDTGDGEKVLCQDTEKGRRIEDGINGLIIQWVYEAGRKRMQRRGAEEVMRRNQEEERQRQEREVELQRRRQELLERQKIEEDRVKELIADAEAWHGSQVLREYIGAVEKSVLDRDGDIGEGGEAAQWLKWARQQADRIDPLTPNPPSIIDERA